MKKNDFDIDEFDLNDLLGALHENVKEDIKSFDDVVNLNAALNREVYLGDIEGGMGTTVEGYIRYWNEQDDLNNIPIEKREPIKLYVHSGGGSLIETFVMIDAIKMSKTPVWTIALGACYSGGFFTFISGHKRIAYPHASFLYHEGATANSGTAAQFRNYTDFYNKQLNQLKDHVLKYTKIDEEKYESIKKDDWWMDVNEAIEYGVVDEVAKEFI